MKQEGEWRTARLYDNAHGVHDMHRYRGTDKRDAEVFHQGPPTEALPAAVRELKESWPSIVEGWERGEAT